MEKFNRSQAYRWQVCQLTRLSSSHANVLASEAPPQTSAPMRKISWKMARGRFTWPVSNLLLLVDLSVRLFSATVRTTLSGAPPGICASIQELRVQMIRHQADDMCNNLVRDPSGVASNTSPEFENVGAKFFSLQVFLATSLDKK